MVLVMRVLSRTGKLPGDKFMEKQIVQIGKKRNWIYNYLGEFLQN
jgi:hypothetical protein